MNAAGVKSWNEIAAYRAGKLPAQRTDREVCSEDAFNDSQTSRRRRDSLTTGAVMLRYAIIFLAHPTKAYLVSWMARILSLKNSWSRKP